MIINIIRVLLSKVFPLITFPYITRVLHEEGVGRYNFAVAFVSYFQLIASLGISTYAIREGARIRDNKTKFKIFANQILLLNIISTGMAYLALFVCLSMSSLEKYKVLIYIYSITIFLTTIGVDWIYSIFEEFTYITVRSFLLQCISLIMLFIFVKDADDLVIYMIITVVSSGASNLFNLIYSRNFVKLFDFKGSTQIVKHIKPVFIIFASALASVVYLNTDTLMLGIISGDKSVGLYSSAVKLNTAFNSIITAVSGVMAPRLSYYLQKKNYDGFNTLINKVMKFLIFAVIPVIIGLIPLAYNIITLFCGKNFYSAGITLKIMLVDLFFAIINGFIAYQVCVPYKKEKYVLIATTCGAISNLCLNLCFIPKFMHNGAAVATVLSECIVFVILLALSKDLINYKFIFNDIWQIIIAALIYIPCYYILKRWDFSMMLELVLNVLVGTILFFIILKLLNNSTINYFVAEIKVIKNRNK